MKTLRFTLIILLTVVIAQLAPIASAANSPITGLLERIDPGASHKFKIELKPSSQDYFELDQHGKRVVVRGNNWISIATGINWYLKYHAGIHLCWNNPTAALPAVLPPVTKRERHSTALKLRYDFNYCTFSYSMPFWDWKRWQQEIDWMALHGVNMPLAATGMETIWRNMLRRLGYDDKEIGEFIAGPAFLAWWAMNNLEGWGGPLPAHWYDQQADLQKKILAAMKSYGMQPVIPGYCGMLPHDAAQRLGVNATDGGKWNGYIRPANLGPTDDRFDEIADIYYDEARKLYGQWTYYSFDPFHEAHDDASIDYAAAGHKLLNALKRSNKDAKWVIQGWTENPRPAMIADLPVGEILILDLFSECRPMWGVPSVWKRKEGYGKHQWLFCLLQNFGANVGLHGRIDQLTASFADTKVNPLAANLKGIGFTMEGSENNPVMFELMSELPWRDEQVMRRPWISAYAQARYGKYDALVDSAWQLLAATIYNAPVGNNQQGPHESIFCARPSLDSFQASSWSKMRNYYDPASTLAAARLIVEAAPAFAGNNNFEYDMVDIVRQALADAARKQYQHAIADYKAFARADFDRSSRRFLDMLLLQDKLLATRSEFCLGHWTEAARSLGTTSADSDLYEWNARVQITTWGHRVAAERGLRDYAHKEWQGLLSDFYYPRWQMYFNALAEQMAQHSHPDINALGEGPNSAKTATELFAMARPAAPQIDWYAVEEPWTLGKGGYTAAPEGNPIEVAREVIDFLTK